MLLYIHFPFCRTKCSYCSFASREYDPQLLRKYLSVLEREIKIRSRSLREKSLSSIYLGGGTPTLLAAAEIQRIMDCVYSFFSPVQGCEITIEANPESIADRIYLKDLDHLGINRISLGVQSLEDRLLSILHRAHNADQSRRAADMILEAGHNLSLDLIWGLPGQTVKSWLNELNRALDLGAQHISCYGLSLEPGTRLQAMVEKDELKCPKERTLAAMYLQGGEYLEDNGFLQYEISNFACPGYTCRHNLGYWSGCSFLGLGPSAVSHVQGRRWRNPATIKDYLLLNAQNFSGIPNEQLTRTQQINELVMLSLRMSKGLNFEEYLSVTGESFCRKYDRFIRELQVHKLIRISKEHLSLTRKGMLVSNSILENFIESEQETAESCEAENQLLSQVCL